MRMLAGEIWPHRLAFGDTVLLIQGRLEAFQFIDTREKLRAGSLAERSNFVDFPDRGGRVHPHDKDREHRHVG